MWLLEKKLKEKFSEVGVAEPFIYLSKLAVFLSLAVCCFFSKWDHISSVLFLPILLLLATGPAIWQSYEISPVSLSICLLPICAFFSVTSNIRFLIFFHEVRMSSESTSGAFFEKKSCSGVFELKGSKMCFFKIYKKLTPRTFLILCIKLQ